MRVIDSKINLEKSFDKLIEELKGSEQEGYYSLKYARLKNAVHSHIIECDAGNSVLAANENDLKDLNIF